MWRYYVCPQVQLGRVHEALVGRLREFRSPSPEPPEQPESPESPEPPEPLESPESPEPLDDTWWHFMTHDDTWSSAVFLTFWLMYN